MTQFDSTFGEELTGPQKTSGLAIGSLVCSLICCLPGISAIGVLLGIGAMVSIGGDPAKKGKGLAITGIVLGTLFTVGQAVIIPKAWTMGHEWWTLINAGPRDALTAGFAGDTAGFKAWFHGPGATATDAEATAFIQELRDRYGEFQWAHVDDQRQPGQSTFGQPKVPFPYVLEFANGRVNANAEIIFADPPTQEGFVNKLGYITVLDDELGELTYPPPGQP